MADLRFESVSKVYGDGTLAVDAASLDVPDGSLCVLVGPSGCGKTTLLRMVAGLETVTSGHVRIGGRVVDGLPPKRRDVAMVFQNYALYPHMSVYDNIGFGLRMRHEPRQRIDSQVRRASGALALDEYLPKQPRLLSGGQRQRVAMGRAMVREPQVLLMDEPLSNLDAKLRLQMRTEIGRRQRELGLTTVYVTHDQVEAMTLGDQVAVLRKGVLQQVAPPQVLFDRPANVFVAGFIGSPPMNLLEGVLEREGEDVALRLGPVRVPLPPALAARWPGVRTARTGPVIVGVRPEDVRDAALDPRLPVRLTAQVEVREMLGRTAQLHTVVPVPAARTEQIRDLAEAGDGGVEAIVESDFVACVDAASTAAEGRPTVLALDPATFYLFDMESGDTLQ